MITRTINTQLVGKEEIFRVMAVGEAMELPILLIGVPGVAKTQGALDYAAGRASFISQLSIGTKPHELRGYIDMSAMVSQKLFKTISPIADAEVVIIDEVDKAYGEIKNVLLSVMREKQLFLGSEGIRQCSWKSFVGCCNVVPNDLTNNPFWDRFVIKYNVERLTSENISKIWKQPMKQFMVNIPEQQDLFPLENEVIELAEQVAEIMYDDTTDRTLAFLPKLIKASDKVWELDDITQAALRSVAFLNPTKLTAVQDAITPPEVADILNRIGFLSTIDNASTLTKHYNVLVADIRKNITIPTAQASLLKRAQAARDASPIVQSANAVKKAFANAVTP